MGHDENRTLAQEGSVVAVLWRKLKILSLVLLTIILLFLLLFFFKTQGKKTLTIGTKNNTEQQILGEIFAQLIEKSTDLQVIRRFNLDGTTIAFNALNSGTIDVYYEYTGTALLHILKEPLQQGDLYPYVKEAFERKYGIIWKQPLGFSNKYVLITHKNSGIKAIDEIESHHKISYDPEFSIREEAIILKKYNPNITPSKLMDQLILYYSLHNGSTDVISGVSTSAQLVNPDLVILKDRQSLLPSYDVAPLIRQERLEKYPELEQIFETLSGAFSVEEMQELIYKVEFEGMEISELATELIDRKF
jgi:glycine betaine/choline ABC-type transport system substrate-binding protein